MENDKPAIFICECGSAEHQILVRYDNEDNVAYVNIHLTKRRFFGRFWYAIKYVFGYQCKYGAFDEIILGKEHSGSLTDLGNRLKH